MLVHPGCCSTSSKETSYRLQARSVKLTSSPSSSAGACRERTIWYSFEAPAACAEGGWSERSRESRKKEGLKRTRWWQVLT